MEYTMTADILDIDLQPVCLDLQIDSDNDFARIERLAKSYNETCCIAWYRSTDGQSAYWGPRGASFEPYWYNAR